jgi:hypothetical protein
VCYLGEGRSQIEMMVVIRLFFEPLVDALSVPRFTYGMVILQDGVGLVQFS